MTGVHRYEDAMHHQMQQLRFLRSPVGTDYTVKFETDLNLRHIVANVDPNDEDPPSVITVSTRAKALEGLIGAGQWPQGRPLLDDGNPQVADKYGDTVREIGAKRGVEQLPVGYLLHLQRECLEQADPVYISSDVTEMIDYARESFDPEPVLPTDPFTFCGFALFSRSLAMDDHPAHEGVWMVYVRALSWIPVFDPDDPDNRGCFWITMYVSAEDDVTMDRGRGVDTRETLSPLAELTCVHSFQWTWGTNPYLDLEGATATRAKAQAALVQTMWRLGSQVVKSTQRLSRPARRDAKRHGARAEDVTVITLRREGERHYDEEGESPEWKSKWLVRGHWRNQYYPSIKEHRQIWIAPYVKGPEHLPLKLTKRVFEFTR